MTEDADSGALSRLRALGNGDDDPGAASKALLMLVALGQLAAGDRAQIPWSVAEVALGDLIARFVGDADVPGDVRAARAFTGLVADRVWELDTELPAEGFRLRWLNEWRVAGRLEPGLDRELRASPALVRAAARGLVTGNFPGYEADEVLAAVGLTVAAAGVSAVTRTDAPDARRGHGAAVLSDYLNLTVSQGRDQFRVLLERQPVAEGSRQAVFLPAETLLCLAASFRVNHRSFGGRTAHRAPEPVPELARLFVRRPSSILAKMANLDGSRSHGAQWDASAGATLREQPTLFTRIYRVLLYSARAEGIGPERLPDFLGLEAGGELELLGQEELAILDTDDLLAESGGADDDALLHPETERIRIAAVRVGQHVFARNVLSNCGSRCVFCGLMPSIFGAKRMLLAGHIKPWRDSNPRERLDLSNGLAACPSHDVAFDIGMLTIEDDLRIRLAVSLSDAVRVDELTRQYYGRPPLLDVVRLPAGAESPGSKYLDWHRKYIFTDRRRSG